MLISRFELSVARRQLLHNRGQTLLTLGVVATSVTLIVFLATLIGGLQRRIIGDTTSMIPHVVVSAPERLPLAPWELPSATAPAAPLFVGRVVKLEQRLRKIEDWPAVVARLRELMPGGVAARVAVAEGQGVVSRESNRKPVTLVGAVPAEFTRVVDLQSNLAAGRYLGLNGGEAVIGYKLAADLNLRLGDRVRVLSSEAVSADFLVAGIVDTGIAVIDRSSLFLNLKDAQSLLNLGSAVTRIGLRLDDVFDASRQRERLEQYLPYEINDWMRDNQRVLSGIRAQNDSSRMIIVFTVLASGLAVASIMVMSVTRKIQEIGILKAIGAKSRQILVIFALQGLAVCAAGAALGCAVGWVLCDALGRIEVVVSATGRTAQLFPVANEPFYYGLAAGLAVVSGVLASLYPAWSASRVDPIHVIRGQ
ncbi:MAG: ABC transporter permease [Verrucomicrobia bacterium]|nr:ABC transporter permease [Verrucomicrobiota bacterium]